MLQLGYVPKFVNYGTQLIRDWHQGRFADKLDPEVQKSLKKTIKSARKYTRRIPNPEKSDPMEILRAYKERFQIYHEQIWPEVKRLVELDLHLEEKRQMLEDFKKKKEELSKKQQEAKEARSKGDSKKANELEKEIDKLKQEMKPYEDMEGKAKEDLKKAIDDYLRKNLEQLNQEIDKREQKAKDLDQQIGQTKREIEELEKELEKQSSQPQDKKDDGAESQKDQRSDNGEKKEGKEEGQQESGEQTQKQPGQEESGEGKESQKTKQGEKQEGEGASREDDGEEGEGNIPQQSGSREGKGGSAQQKKDGESQGEQQGEQQGSDTIGKSLAEKRQQLEGQTQEQQKTKDELEQIKSELEKSIEKQQQSPMPFPADQLSPETLKELEKLFNKLSPDKKQELKEKAEKQLEDLEDAINKDMEGKLTPDDHKPPDHEEIRQIKEEQERARKEREKIEQDQKELEEKLEALGEQLKTEYDRIYQEVSDLINALYIRLERLFVKEKHPQWRKGYQSGMRVDLDKAMQAEADPKNLEKMWERKTAPKKFDYRFSLVVDLSGSMHTDGRKIEQTFKGIVVLVEVLERLNIQCEVIGYSDFLKVFKKWETKLDKQSRDHLVSMKRWGKGNTDTTAATALAEKDIKENIAKYSFLATFTDGQPNDPESLMNLLGRIKKEGKIKLVGIGLGPGTEFVKEYYPASSHLPNIRPTEKEKKQGAKDFAETFGDLLEDMIRHPENY